MMKRNATCLIMAMLFIAFISMSHADGSTADEEDLEKFISDNEDVHMTAEDLAFFLVTHDFDARPKGDYIIVNLDDATYKLVPNGDKPGLAEMSVIS
jgi:hypothetical protein